MKKDSPVLEIQQEAMNASSSVSALLRKAYVVAKKLKLQDAIELFSSELNGYKEKVPEYRQLFGDLKAHNPYHGYIPFMINDEKVANLVRKMPIGQSVESLEVLLNLKDGAPIISHFEPSQEQQLMRMMDPPLRPSLHVDKSQIQDILNKVRRLVLDWALELEEKGILGEGVLFSEKEKIAASSTHSIQIQNFSGILGDVSGGTINQSAEQTVNQGDLKSLAEYMKSLGISESDTAELLESVKGADTPDDKSISSWVGKMTSKAFRGTWNYAKEKASTVLLKGIFGYFGIPYE